MKKALIFTILLCFAIATQAELRLPAFFGDHMVLQRDMPVKIWGEATPGKKVTVQLAGKKASAKADKSGKWVVTLPEFKAGGPYEMTVKSGKEVVSMSDILFGEVWLCSGQSNMEWRLRDVRNADQELANANYPMMRSFNVEKAMANKPQDDFIGKWEVCTPITAQDFTAVGYFFALNIHKELNVPVGFINSSWGGTDIEPWMSTDAIKQFPRYNDKIAQLLSDDFEAHRQQSIKEYAAFEEAMRNDKGEQEKWFNPSFDRLNWATHMVPQEWSNKELAPLDGVVWFSYKFQLTPDLLGKDAILRLACIDDSDKTWINGEFIGETHGYNVERTYIVPSEALKAENEIVVKITDTGNGGGIYGNASDAYLMIGNRKVSLQGEWSYKVSISNADYNIVQYGPNTYPSLLYNAMISPLVGLGMQGVIWYQGCNNTNRAYEYYDLFPALINDWRLLWGREFPFYWVNLANFLQPVEEPVESDWARLRDAQTATLKLPKTGQAVIIDIGEANDIHPRNKQDVGARLARHALHNEYGFDIEYKSPMVKSVERIGDALVVTFDNVAKGLEIHDRYGYLCSFALAGADGKYYYAKARIEGTDQVVVTCDKVKNPISVRYAWADNPDDANLYNSEGLPATPFEVTIER